MKVFLPIAPPAYSQQSIQRANFEIARAFEQADARYLSQDGGAIADASGSTVPLTVTGASGASIQEWKHDADGLVALVNPAGNFLNGARAAGAPGDVGCAIRADGRGEFVRTSYGKAYLNQTTNVVAHFESDSASVIPLQITNGNFRSVSPSVPASAAAAGSAGEIAWDASFLYVCTAANTWKRAALSTW